MTETKFPTEFIELPSKGHFYPEDNPLSSGKVEMKYMTAREEDILTSVNLINQGVVIDKLLEELIIDKKINMFVRKSYSFLKHHYFGEKITHILAPYYVLAP